MAARSRPERVLNAIVAVQTRLSRMTAQERVAMTAKARAARQAQLEDQVDPNRDLDPEQRAARVSALRRAEMTRLARLATAAKARRRQAATAERIARLITEAANAREGRR